MDFRTRGKSGGTIGNQVEWKSQVEEEEQVEKELDQGEQGLGTHQEAQ